MYVCMYVCMCIYIYIYIYIYIWSPGSRGWFQSCVEGVLVVKVLCDVVVKVPRMSYVTYYGSGQSPAHVLRDVLRQWSKLEDVAKINTP